MLCFHHLKQQVLTDFRISVIILFIRVAMENMRNVKNHYIIPCLKNHKISINFLIDNILANILSIRTLIGF